MRKISEGLGAYTVRLRDDGGLTPVGILTYTWMKGDIGQKLDVKLVALLHHTFGAEDGVGARAGGTCECGHVLNHTKDLKTFSACSACQRESIKSKKEFDSPGH